jgi:hypothetical protein
MLGRGDWQKLEDKINQVLIPLGRRVKALEAQVEALEAAKVPPKAPKVAKAA